MTTYTITVTNNAVGCNNEIEQQISVTGCSTYIVRLTSNSNALGPFNVYLDSTLIYSDQTRNEMLDGVVVTIECGTPTPTPTPTITPTTTPVNTTPTNTPTLTQTPTNSVTPTNTTTPTLTPTNTATPTLTPTPTVTIGLTPTTTQSQTPTTTATPTNTPTNTETQTPTPTTSETPTNTPTNTETPTNTPSETPTQTPTNTETPTQTPSETPGNTPTNTSTQTVTPSNTATPTNTVTPTVTETPTNTPTASETSTPTVTPSNTETPTPTVTETPTNTPTANETSTPTVTPSNTATPTNTQTPTVTETPTQTVTPSVTETPTETPTNTPTTTETPTETPTNTPTVTETPTQTQTPTNTLTPTPTTTPNRNFIASNFNTTGGMSITFLPTIGFTITGYVPPVDYTQTKNAFHDVIPSGSTLDVLTSGTTRGTLQLLINTILIDTNTLDAGSTWTITFNSDLNENDIVEIRLMDAPTPTPTLTPTNTQTPTVTATNTQTPTVTATNTETPTVTPTVTATNTPTYTQTPTHTATPTPTSPPFQAYLFIDRNDATIRTALNNYMLSQGSAFRGFNINNVTQTQATFDAQMNAYIAYSGWGVSEPSIFTAPISTTSGGSDAYGNPIVAYKFQTIQVPNTTVPAGEVAWYTWIVATGMTNGQKYSTIKNGNANPPITDTVVNTLTNSLVVNYSGSTNIPAGTYRVYTTKTASGLNITNSGNNWYFQGGTLV